MSGHAGLLALYVMMFLWLALRVAPLQLSCQLKAQRMQPCCWTWEPPSTTVIGCASLAHDIDISPCSYDSSEYTGVVLCNVGDVCVFLLCCRAALLPSPELPGTGRRRLWHCCWTAGLTCTLRIRWVSLPYNYVSIACPQHLDLDSVGSTQTHYPTWRLPRVGQHDASHNLHRISFDDCEDWENGAALGGGSQLCRYCETAARPRGGSQPSR